MEKERIRGSEKKNDAGKEIRGSGTVTRMEQLLRRSVQGQNKEEL